MLVKTQRRRISPRTRRRCLAIRGFFKKALDTCTTTSQFFTKCGSNVFNNHMNQKILDLENQVNALSQSDIDKNISMEKIIKVKNITPVVQNSHIALETEVLYRTPEYKYKRCSSRPSQNYSELGDATNQNLKGDRSHIMETNDRKRDDREISSQKLKFDCSNAAYMDRIYSAYYVENEHYIKKHRTRKHCSEHKQSKKLVSEIIEEKNRSVKTHKKRGKGTKISRQTSEFYIEDRNNKKYIAEIIRKQYKPVVEVDKKTSEISQFSVPICRDSDGSPENYSSEHIFNVLSPTIKGDVREYAVKKESCRDKPKHKRHRKSDKKVISHNDSDLYDLIPVKEKSTPKSRRKFAEDQMILSRLYKEVPPSPRTNRPRLNLTVKHYTEYADCQNILAEHNELGEQIQRDLVIEDRDSKFSFIDEPILMESKNEVINNNTRHYETDLHLHKINKSDDTLTEIKETLQQFLQEVKKESSMNGITDNRVNNNHCYGTSHAVLPVLNSCYYPIVPICPINYMHSAFIPSSSTCAACAHTNDSEGTVAEQLIKQIHLGATPNLCDNHQNQAFRNNDYPSNNRPLTSKSAGSGKVFNCCDVDVQIPNLNCISNSTATIGSKVVSKQTNILRKPSYSDSNLERATERLPYIDSVRAMQGLENNSMTIPGRLKKFFKNFGTLKRSNSTYSDKKGSRNEDFISSQLSQSKALRRSPSALLIRESVTPGSISEIPHQIRVHDSFYLNRFYLKEVQVKCAATQSERRKQRFFEIFSKRKQDKIIYASKPCRSQKSTKWFRWRLSRDLKKQGGDKVIEQNLIP